MNDSDVIKCQHHQDIDCVFCNDTGYIAQCPRCRGLGTQNAAWGRWVPKCVHCDGEGTRPATARDIQKAIDLRQAEIDVRLRSLEELKTTLSIIQK